jgi:predicted dehydrogenase/nucleoside-diphosphate-sugar epimerase
MPPISNSRPLRVAVVGCGAVTKASLLPVLSGHERIEVIALVDRDVARARELADAYGIARTESDVSAVSTADADAIVLATPPAHHAPATIDLSGKGFHVFVEKPMAVRSADALAMVDAANRAGVVLAVGLYRRLLPVSRLLRGVIEQGLVGRPVAVDIEEGGEYSWQLATLSGLTREGGGGGVLIDLGTHLIDQLMFVLPGETRLTQYADNARGGIETDCEVRLEIDSRWGRVPARIELSRTRQLRGTIRITCERGTLELVRSDFRSLRVIPVNAEATDAVAGETRAFELSAQWAGDEDLIGYKAFRREFDDWLDAIGGRTEPQLSGRSVVPVVQLVEACYQNVTPLAEPWTDGGLDLRAIESLSPATSGPYVNSGHKPRVLITGAGGFLGCRSVELLQATGQWDVRAAVRRPGSAARLARLPVEIVIADACSPEQMKAALAGCDAVVHCAVGTDWPPEASFKVTVDGTRTVAETAQAAGVRRFVHISSMAVHGDEVPARLDETVPQQPGSGASYQRAKFLAEQSVSQWAERGLPAISLRPARIYGPHSRTFTVRPLTALHTGRLILAGDADTTSNMVYVDNVVEAIACALVAAPSENGRAFLISEPDQLSWRKYYEFFADAAGARLEIAPYPALEATRPGLAHSLVHGTKQILKSSELRGLVKKIMATDPYGVLPRKIWDGSPALQRRVLPLIGVDSAVVYREPARAPSFEVSFRINPTTVVFDQATSRLGYDARVPRTRAMELTLDWARQARLL